MARKYLGFGIRLVEKKAGLFRRQKQEEVFCKIRINGVENFAEAQQTLVDNMKANNFLVGIIFPCYQREKEDWEED